MVLGEGLFDGLDVVGGSVQHQQVLVKVVLEVTVALVDVVVLRVVLVAFGVGVLPHVLVVVVQARLVVVLAAAAVHVQVQVVLVQEAVHVVLAGRVHA